MTELPSGDPSVGPMSYQESPTEFDTDFVSGSNEN